MASFEFENEWFEAAIFESKLHELAIYDADEWSFVGTVRGLSPAAFAGMSAIS